MGYAFSQATNMFWTRLQPPMNLTTLTLNRMVHPTERTASEGSYQDSKYGYVPHRPSQAAQTQPDDFRYISGQGYEY
jgi:hypothetical protein